MNIKTSILHSIFTVTELCRPYAYIFQIQFKQFSPLSYILQLSPLDLHDQIYVTLCLVFTKEMNANDEYSVIKIGLCKLNDNNCIWKKM